MVERSLSQQTQTDPPSPPQNGDTPRDGVWLTSQEWSEALDIDMAFHAAVNCDVDEQHKLELIKSVQVRYSRFVQRVSNRLHPDD